MNNFFRGIIAAYGAKKLGGGCFSTIVIFILIYVALGTCNKESRAAVIKPSHVKARMICRD
ncbi:hypothetical protein DJ568_03730 [Mucilaginibacter hurinus]|uniref:Uncharacterized protein n=1 Tax=Mucilaginibacter hurinus TaxID=2201324 RepID=A0A367GQX5_9SPHI|nr:hypothetical protein [Mucilaginibacter hurinus]RCH55874.1 hypothetical protein DJ568_03730 [Mucilaginibacter hurinus]